MEKVSSYGTFFWKFVFPTIWSGGFGLGAIASYFSDANESTASRWSYIVVWLLGTALLWWLCGPLKRVRIRGDALLVSNYLTEIEVPRDEIAEVRQNLFFTSSLKPIRVTFRKSTPFGASIVFMPPTSLRIFSEDPAAQQVRDFASRGHGASAQQGHRADGAR